MGLSPRLQAAGEAMWAFVERYTGHVRYKRGAKAAALNAELPVIDCSGWAAVLLAAGTKATTSSAGESVFNSNDIAAVNTWSDQMIAVLEQQSGWVLEDDKITAATLPPFATTEAQS